MKETPALEKQTSSVYGPVHSWRVGNSLGVDVLLETSTCSFNCIYCQLGDIQQKTIERRIYVPTEKVEWDFKTSRWEEADIITFSGSGEPTLALNLAEVVDFIKDYTANPTPKPIMVLTNATLLHDAAVQRDLARVDIVAAKLDAATEQGLRQMNRPVPGVTLESIVTGIEAFRQGYTGKLCLQCMFMPTNLAEASAMAALIQRLQPDEVQLNTPKRPYPLEWVVDSRGNHQAVEYPARTLRTVTPEQAAEIEALLRAETGVPILSIYR